MARTSIMFLAVAVSLAALSTALPTALKVSPQALASVEASANLTTPVPVGVWTGSLGIVPYTGSPGQYKCLACNAVYAPVTATFTSNYLTLAVSAASAGSCHVGQQQYAFTNLQPHSGGAYPYYYTASLKNGGSTIPVCLYLDNQGTFVITLDGQGTCPAKNTPPSCNAGPAPGTVVQSWSGHVARSSLPSGKWKGTGAVVPFTKQGGTYSCTTCGALSPSAIMTWGGNTLTIGFGKASRGSCGMSAQTYVVSNVVEYGPQYPNYYRGMITVEGSTIPVCFIFDGFGNFIMMLDGVGTCPNPSSTAICKNSGGGAVVQVWTAALTPY